MKEKIKEFIYSKNSSLSDEENLKVQNHSNHENVIHQTLFKVIDEFAKRVVKDIHNSFSNEVFNDNQLNIISDEPSIEELILSGLRRQGHDVKSLNNPEMIYRAFNFVKPSNLLPQYNTKIYLLKQLGISESGKEKTYVINPYFFGFKISFDIFIHSMFCSEYDNDIESSLVKILTDKYGEEFKDIYEYVSYVAGKAAHEGQKKGDKEDETFIAGVKAISGLNNNKIFYNFIYESAILTATQNANALKGS